jgi:hypothetical protein
MLCAVFLFCVDTDDNTVRSFFDDDKRNESEWRAGLLS